MKYDRDSVCMDSEGLRINQVESRDETGEHNEKGMSQSKSETERGARGKKSVIYEKVLFELALVSCCIFETA